jgi:hypothetical protein
LAPGQSVVSDHTGQRGADDTDEKAVILTIANPSDPEQSALRIRIAAGANHRRYRFIPQNYLFG